MSNLNMFDEMTDGTRFKTALERYGIFPTTVWDIDMQNNMTRTLKAAMQDKAGREGMLKSSTITTDGTGISQFNPQVAANILNLYAPNSGVCFDPFGGGGVRAIMAAARGLDYIGMEIRPEQVAATKAKVAEAGLQATIIEGDARYTGLAHRCADFIFTCPPYFNMEVYSDHPDDLSNRQSYQQFLADMADVVAEAYRVADVGCVACWVVGLHRYPDGSLMPLHHDLAAIHRQQGWVFKEEIILRRKGDGSIQRVGNFEKGNNLLIRQHEYCLVFHKAPR